MRRRTAATAAVDGDHSGGELARRVLLSRRRRTTTTDAANAGGEASGRAWATMRASARGQRRLDGVDIIRGGGGRCSGSGRLRRTSAS